MSANLDGLDNSISQLWPPHIFSNVLKCVFFNTLLFTFSGLEKSIAHPEKAQFLPSLGVFGIVESSGAVMGVALGLACSVPA